jgi:rod shape determining protein RodA
MTMGLTPITGMTLPLISYGGSSLVVNCAALGLLVNVGMRRPILLARRPFEHGEKRQKPLALGTMSHGPASGPQRER